MTDDLDRQVALAMGWELLEMANDIWAWRKDNELMAHPTQWKPSTDGACAFRALHWLLGQSQWQGVKDSIMIKEDPYVVSINSNMHYGGTLNEAICHAVIAEGKR